MTVVMPFRPPLSSLGLRSPSTVRTSTTTADAASRFSFMADQSNPDSQETQMETDPRSTENYPVPLSPPLPAISKEIELNRAMAASSKSSLFSLSKSDVLLEDDWIIALNKPQGVYCETILASVPSLFTDSCAGSGQIGTQSKKLEFHLANRLDRDTSGVTLITKSHKIAAKFVKAFTKHEVRKTYIAFCVGRAPKWRKITVKSGHGRSRFGAWRVYAASDVGQKLPGGSSVRDMETLFEVISVNGKGGYEELSGTEKKEKEVVVVEEKSIIKCEGNKDEVLVRAYPQSGRTHQIRLHCQYLGIPIRGDVKYEGVYEWNGRVYGGHELHAESLSFSHPVTGLPVLIKAPLPSWATQVMQPSCDR